MSQFIDFINYLMVALVVENVLFSRAFAVDNIFGVYRNRRSGIRFTALMSSMLLVSMTLEWLLRRWIGLSSAGQQFLTSFGKPYLGLLCALIIYLLVMLPWFFFVRHLYYRYALMLPAALFNCTVLGSMLVSFDRALSFVKMLGYCVGMSVGFLIATLIVMMIRRRAMSLRIPRSFRGLPIELLIVGLIGLALSAFTLA